MADPVKKAEHPRLAEFIYENVEIPGYERTYVPGESELTARLLGIPPKYTYENKVSVIPEQFKEDQLKNPSLWKIYIDKVWESIGESAYDPSESPLIEVEEGVFEANPKTRAGKALQGRWDLAYSRSRHQKKDRNPDRDYQLMLKGEEPLLGDIYFDEEGNFEDIWNISMDKREKVFSFDPKDDWGTNIDRNVTNLLRLVGAPLLERNQPVVRGKATYRGYE